MFQKLKDYNFALTIDESTDISNTSQLLAFVHFIRDEIEKNANNKYRSKYF